jgi:hypothetical protein
MTDCNSWVEMNMSAKRPKNRAMMAAMAVLKRGSEKKPRSSIGSLARISHATKATMANTATTKAVMVGGLDQPLPRCCQVAPAARSSPISWVLEGYRWAGRSVSPARSRNCSRSRTSRSSVGGKRSARPPVGFSSPVSCQRCQ